jgi:hypothetical protein
LKRLSAAHVAAIEKLKPYNGVDWTKWLVIVSNPDKHRHLIVSTVQQAIRTRYGFNPNPPADASIEQGLVVILEGRVADGDEPAMYVQFHILEFITIGDGLRVIDALEHQTQGCRYAC